MLPFSPTILVWLVLLVVFLIAEAATVTLISLWFAAGCLGALIVAMFGLPLWLQLGVALGLSLVCIALLRPLARRYLTPKLTATNVSALVGQECFVTEDIDNLVSTGQVKLGSMPWTARSTDGQPIKAGTLVKVDRIEGVKAIVSPVHVPVH